MKAVHTTLGSWSDRGMTGECMRMPKSFAAIDKLNLVTAIVLCTLVTVACGPADPAPNGEIRVEFIAASSTGIDLEIQNGSPQPIQLRGLRSSPARIELWPDDLAIECKSPSASVSTEEPFSISHDTVHPEVVSVASTERLQLIVRKPMPPNSDEATCKVRLRLASGLVVESGEFRR